MILPNARRLEARVLRARLTQSCPDAVRVSIGVAHRKPSESCTELLARADRALYLAKRSLSVRGTARAAA